MTQYPAHDFVNASTASALTPARRRGVRGCLISDSYGWSLIVGEYLGDPYILHKLHGAARGAVACNELSPGSRRWRGRLNRH